MEEADAVGQAVLYQFGAAVPCLGTGRATTDDGVAAFFNWAEENFAGTPLGFVDIDFTQSVPLTPSTNVSMPSPGLFFASETVYKDVSDEFAVGPDGLPDEVLQQRRVDRTQIFWVNDGVSKDLARAEESGEIVRTDVTHAQPIGNLSFVGEPREYNLSLIHI